MKNNLIEIIGSNKNFTFNRKLLIKGYNRQGIEIPNGGIILKNGDLAGYMLRGGKKEKKWSIIGKANSNDSNIKHIPYYKDIIKGGSRETKEVSLKTAVNLLRKYYRTKFN